MKHLLIGIALSLITASSPVIASPSAYESTEGLARACESKLPIKLGFCYGMLYGLAVAVVAQIQNDNLGAHNRSCVQPDKELNSSSRAFEFAAWWRGYQRKISLTHDMPTAHGVALYIRTRSLQGLGC